MEYPGIDITEAAIAKEVWSHMNERYFRTMLEALMKCARFHGLVFDRWYVHGFTLTNELFTDMVREVSIARISFLNPLYTDDDIYRQVENDSHDGYAQKWVKDLLDGLSAQNIRLRYADSAENEPSQECINSLNAIGDLLNLMEQPESNPTEQG